MTVTTISHRDAVVAAELRVECARHLVKGKQIAEALGESEMWVSRRLRGKVAVTVGEREAILDAIRAASRLPHMDSNHEPAGLRSATGGGARMGDGSVTNRTASESPPPTSRHARATRRRGDRAA